MLKRRYFIVIEAGFPAHFRSGVHRFPVRQIKLRRLLEIALRAQSFRPDLGVFLPQFHIRGEAVDHSGLFAVPVRMCVSVEDNVGHVTRADDRAGHDP